MPGEVLCRAFPNDVKISEDEDMSPMERCKTSYASAPSLSFESYLLSLQTSLALPGVLPQQNTTGLCITWDIQKHPLQATTATICLFYFSECGYLENFKKEKCNVINKFIIWRIN